jgi:hypothetical protein
MNLALGLDSVSANFTTPEDRPRLRSVANQLLTMCLEVKEDSDLIYLPPPPLPPSSVNLHELNLKSEADRRKTFKTWCVPFIDATQLAAAGFYFPKWSDVVCSAFCEVQLGSWEVGDDAFKEHQRWSPSCSFVKGLCVGNIPIRSNDQPETSSSSQQTNNSCDVYTYHMQYRPNSCSERCKYIFTFICFVYLFVCKIVALH